MVFKNPITNEQMSHFCPAQSIAAVGLATIFKKMRAICAFLESQGGISPVVELQSGLRLGFDHNSSAAADEVEAGGAVFAADDQRKTIDEDPKIS